MPITNHIVSARTELGTLCSALPGSSKNIENQTGPSTGFPAPQELIQDQSQLQFNGHQFQSAANRWHQVKNAITYANSAEHLQTVGKRIPDSIQIYNSVTDTQQLMDTMASIATHSQWNPMETGHLKSNATTIQCEADTANVPMHMESPSTSMELNRTIHQTNANQSLSTASHT